MASLRPGFPSLRATPFQYSIIELARIHIRVLTIIIINAIINSSRVGHLKPTNREPYFVLPPVRLFAKSGVKGHVYNIKIQKGARTQQHQ